MSERRARFAGLALAGAAGAALISIAWSSQATAAQGWLCAFVILSMVPVGSLALLLVHGVTGGRWGWDLAPLLVPAARSAPLLLVAFLPVMLFRPLVYHWHDFDLPQDVRTYYLNPAFFDARTLVALAVWSGLAWCRAWRNPVGAGLGLFAHLVLCGFVPADWVLTLPPGSTSAGFGWGFGVEQVAAALAAAAIVAPQGDDARASQDLAGMIAAALLGTVYFAYMQFIVIWYGNVPDKVHWYVTRAAGGWPAFAFAAFAIGGALPFLAILNPVVRSEAARLRLVGASVLIGVVLHVAWLTAPAFGAAVLGTAALALLVMAPPILAAACVPPIAAKAASDAD